MDTRLGAVDTRLDDMNQNFATRLDDVNQSVTKHLNDLNRTLIAFMWVVSSWFIFLMGVLAVFGLLRR